MRWIGWLLILSFCVGVGMSAVNDHKERQATEVRR